MKSLNTVWYQPAVNRSMREQLNGHKSAVLWFTGFSGSGKSTIAHAVEELLNQFLCSTYVLDGDNVRHGLCGDLGFSIADRHENIRRLGEVSKLFADAGVITLSAFISPLRADRERVRHLVGEDFIEIYCKCPIEVCEDRDVKGLYKKARKGEIEEFTGISSPYEEPHEAEVVIDTSCTSVDAAANMVLTCLFARGILSQTDLQKEL